MKPQLIRLLGLMAGGMLLAAAASVSASVVTVSYYRLGEQDPGAVAGQPAKDITVDSGTGTANLHVLGIPPTYSANTGVNGSTLCAAVAGGGYTNGAPVLTLSDNWGIEARVLASSSTNSLSSDGYAQIAYNGNSGPNGMGLYAIPGGQFGGLCGGVAVVGGAPYVPGTWMHLALVVAGGQTTFYTNGVVAATGPAPNPPTTGYFGLGINPNKPGGWEPFQGSIDEVRVFAFAPGEFSTNDLLLTSVPPTPQPPVIVAGPTVTPPGAILSGTEYFASGTPFSLGVTVGGTGPVSFQWGQNGTNLSGATNGTLTFANPTSIISGNYSVVVSNTYGAVTSSVVSVTVLGSASSSLIPLAYYRLGENDPGAVAGQTADDTTVDIVNGTNLSVAGIPPTYSANTGVRGSTLCIAVDGGGYAANAPVASLTDNWGTEAWVLASSSTNSLSSDGYASIVYNGNSSSGGMGIYQNPSGQFVGFCGNVALVGGATTVPGTWTHLAIVTTGGTTTFYVNGVATGTGPRPNASVDAFSIGFNAVSGAEAFQGSIDEVRVFAVLPGHFSVSDLLLSRVPPGALPPSVISGPTVAPGPLVLSGSTFSLSVVASGTAPLHFQWRHADTAISGATASTLTVTNVTASASGGYDVVITNVYGSTTSAVAVVTVLPPGSPSVAPVAYYRLGENDPGAVAGQTADDTTVDSVSGLNLSSLGTPPTYSVNTGVKGSTLCIDVNGGGYQYATPLITNADNWGIEAWVLATSSTNSLSSDGYAQIAYNGNSGNGGMGLYCIPGGQFAGLCGGIAVVGGATFVPGTWMHLALVTTGGTTTFYTNGVANATGPAPAPPTDFFGLGINPSNPGGWEPFQGRIDEVRIFSVTFPGQFSTNDLLLTSVPPALSVHILQAGGNAILLWNAGNLQQANALAGPWDTVAGATSPWVTPVVGTRFFRVVQP